MTVDLLRPDWPAPPNVRAAVTTRRGGVSAPPRDSLNLALHVGDDPAAVAQNRQLLRQQLGLEREPGWLEQVHGTRVLTLDGGAQEDKTLGVNRADASVTRVAGQACVVMTADCLPVLFCDRAGTVVAASHAGWRGLAAGVLRATVKAMAVDPANIVAWFGPAIGPAQFEVGGEVVDVFMDNAISDSHRSAIPACFAASPTNPGKLLADIYALGRAELNALGVNAVYGGGLCTVTDRSNWYSYRRAGVTGRMASLIWLAL